MGLINTNKTDHADKAIKDCGLLTSFGGILQGRPEVRGLYYNKQTLTLDGYSFIGCRFDNCKLLVSSLNFDLIKCVVDPSTEIAYSSSVLKIIQLFNSRYPWASEHYADYFVPKQNEDGTITISDCAA